MSDLDRCLVDGKWTPLAIEIRQLFPTARVAVSRSGTGLHIYGEAFRVPSHRCKNNDLDIELYTNKKFVCVSDIHATGQWGVDCSDAIRYLCEQYFPPKEGVEAGEWTDHPRADWRGYEDDGVLLSAAMAAQSGQAVFAGKASFGDLWDARAEKLARSYPDAVRPYGESEADAALATHLAYWTGCDCVRIERLMRESALARPKWDERDDYLERTILGACAIATQVHHTGAPDMVKPPHKITPEASVPEASVCRPTGQVLTPDNQRGYFHGCVYIKGTNRIRMPSGEMLDAKRFRAAMGGFVFAMDAEMEKFSTNAWEAFTESRAVFFPKVELEAFRPNMTPGAIFHEDGVSLCNVFVPIETPRTEGDPSPFLSYFERLLPAQQDRDILLAYMAACIQHIGIKFQWCPLIQGVEGNGKSMISHILQAALGAKYCHWPKARDIDNKFNAWMSNKLLICIEDIYVPHDQKEVIEALKPMITGEWQDIQGKGENQISQKICANLIVNTNHRNAIPKTDNDRRWAVFFTAQQTRDDLDRDHVGLGYAKELWDWLKKRNGFAIMHDYLARYAIPDELNPAGDCHRAPETTTTAEAITASMGPVEQSILEMIESEAPGFAGGWVSSVALDNALIALHAQRVIPANKRKDFMEGLGFVLHPALKDGRINSPSDVDSGRRPRLYVRPNSIQAHTMNPTEIMSCYLSAQRKTTMGAYRAAR
jgi:hypothetical protein